MLDVAGLAREGVFVPRRSGRLTWTDSQGKQTASIGFLVMSADGNCLLLRLSYRWNGVDIVIPVRLQTTRPNYGGRRWWFTCPLATDGVACNSRVGKLYSKGKYFGCRRCHGLTYKSCQESRKTDQFDDLYVIVGEQVGRPAEAVRRYCHEKGEWARDQLINRLLLGALAKPSGVPLFGLTPHPGKAPHEEHS